jgi:hypothetical protein
VHVSTSTFFIGLEGKNKHEKISPTCACISLTLDGAVELSQGRRTPRAASRWKQVAAGAEASTAESCTSPAAAPPPASNKLIRSIYGASQQAVEKSNMASLDSNGTAATLAVFSLTVIRFLHFSSEKQSLLAQPPRDTEGHTNPSSDSIN